MADTQPAVIQLSELTKSFGDRTLLERVTWQIGDGDRVGLCGPNGAGKTTLLKMLAGLDEPDSGAHHPAGGADHRLSAAGRSRAFGPHGVRGSEQRVPAAARHEGGDARHRASPRRCRRCRRTDHDAMLARYAELQDRFPPGRRLQHGPAHRDGAARARLQRRRCDRPCETFSGGWQMRIALAKLLLGRPNLLLLDEPTNHLDLDARNWLEEYLGDYPYAVILVSHDRYFLDAVVTRITDLNLRRLTDYVGNYSKYVEQRDAMLERLRQAKREQDEEVARVKMFIDRFRYQATKAAQVQSRIKLLEKVVPIEVPPERKRIHFTFPACAKSGRTVLELKHVRKAYGRPDRLPGREPAHRARRSHRAGRPERRRQVDADAHALGRRRRPTPARAPSATRSSWSTSRRTKPYASTRRSPSTRRWRRARRTTWFRRSATSSAGSCSRATTSTRRRACCRAANARGSRWRACCCGRRTRCCSTSRRTTSTSTRRTSCSTRWRTTAARSIIVSHDRYFVEKLATKIIEIGHGQAIVYPGTYSEFLWSKASRGSGLGIRDSGARRPGLGARDPGLAPGLGDSGRDPAVPEGATSSSPRRQAIESRAPSPESRTPASSPEPRAPSPEPQAPGPESRIPSPGKSASGSTRSARRSSARSSRCTSELPTSKRASRSAKRAVKELEARDGGPGLLREP